MERWRKYVSAEDWNWYLSLATDLKAQFEKATDDNMKFLDRVCLVNNLTEEEYNQLPSAQKLELCAQEMMRTVH